LTLIFFLNIFICKTASDYPQDEPIPETTNKTDADKDAASAAEPEPESETGKDKKKLGGDDHDYRDHHNHHDHDHNDLGHGHVHGSPGRQLDGSSSSGVSVSKFEAVTWMITTLTSVGLLMNQNGIMAL